MWSSFSKFILRAPLQSLRDVYNPNTTISPLFQEGIYLSSVSFFSDYEKRETMPDGDKKKLERTFFKYWIRSCTRSTPYATFAGNVVGKIQESETTLILDPENHAKSIRLDMEYVHKIINLLLRDERILKQLLFFTNNSLYQLPNGYRYAEYSLIKGIREYTLAFVNKSDYLDTVLKRAQTGATIAALTAELMSTTGATQEESEDFLLEMIQSQLLISELEPPVTGKQTLYFLIDKLRALQHSESVLQSLTNLTGIINSSSVGIAHYKQIESSLSEIEQAIQDIPKDKFQTDLYLAVGNCTINKDIVNSIVSQASELIALSRINKNRKLDEFKKRFVHKYEEAEVPLNIALDPDLGIGYGDIQDESVGGSDIINDLIVATIPEVPLETDYLQHYSNFKYRQYLKTNASYIEIKEEELSKLKRPRQPRFPHSMYLLGNLLKTECYLGTDNYMFDLLSFSGPSAANLLGRFAEGESSIKDFLDEIIRKEEDLYSDVIFAEIVHLPQSRLGNVLHRPILRSFEIPYVGISGAESTSQIEVSDLMIKVVNDEVIIRSKNLGKRIYPRLTTAHNFSTNSNLPIYKFLCDLQAQNAAYPNIWDWGILANEKFLPRVVYKNLIVKKAQWRIDINDVAEISLLKNPSKQLKEFREQNNLPTRVVYIEGDNELLIDFDHEAGIDIFFHYLKRYKRIQVQEFLFTEDNCVVNDNEGKPYTNELIIPVFHTHRYPYVIPSNNTELNVKRSFLPGSEWLYFKVYCGPKVADMVLKDVVSPFVDQCYRQQLLQRFFFVRYKDDFSHLRLRFYDKNKANLKKVEEIFLQAIAPLVDNGFVHKICVDTYVRELERYNPAFIEEAEQLFSSDSLSVLNFIRLLPTEKDEYYRLVFALRGIDMLLNDFGLNTETRNALFKNLQRGYMYEFGGHIALQKQLNDKYRDFQKRMFSFMDPRNDVKNEIEDGVSVFNKRSLQNAAPIELMRSKINGGEQEMIDVLVSHIHMFTNRLFIAQNRKYELVAYHYLERYYSSLTAIKKKQKDLL